jgi:acyl-CoA hydrolase
MQSIAKPPSHSKIQISLLTQMSDANFRGTVHGGYIMKVADEAGAMAAMRHAQQVVVTVCIDSLTFEQPVQVGHLLHVQAQPTWVGHTSIEVQLQITAEDPLTGVCVATNSAFIVYVAVDAAGHPQAVPPLLCETEAEQAQFVAGAQRRQYRLKQAAQAKT